MLRLTHKGQELKLNKFQTRVMLNTYLSTHSVEKAVQRVEELKKKGDKDEVRSEARKK